MADCKKASNLNSIDLSSTDIPTSVSLLKQACMDSGFFYVTNHGISEEFMDQVFTQSKNFFNLPLEEKMKLLRNEKHRGYTPVLDELLDPDNQVHGDYKEGFYIGIELPEDDPEAQRTFYGPNLWPDSDILPGWRQTMEKYHQEALEVVRKTARLIALALDLDADFFQQPEMLGKPIAILRLLHYPGQVSEPTKGIFGAGAHSDYGLITVLATDNVPGLQICKDKDARPQVWEDVEPLKGAFVVNLGDMLERWSNGIFRYKGHPEFLTFDINQVNDAPSAEQRARAVFCMTTSDPSRFSLPGLIPCYWWDPIPYFVEPSHDCVVECLPTCKSKENPPKYPRIKCETYLFQRYQDTHADLSAYSKPGI